MSADLMIRLRNCLLAPFLQLPKPSKPELAPARSGAAGGGAPYGPPRQSFGESSSLAGLGGGAGAVGQRFGAMGMQGSLLPGHR